MKLCVTLIRNRLRTLLCHLLAGSGCALSVKSECLCVVPTYREGVAGIIHEWGFRSQADVGHSLGVSISPRGQRLRSGDARQWLAAAGRVRPVTLSPLSRRSPGSTDALRFPLYHWPLEKEKREIKWELFKVVKAEPKCSTRETFIRCRTFIQNQFNLKSLKLDQAGTTADMNEDLGTRARNQHKKHEHTIIPMTQQGQKILPLYLSK